MAISLDDLQNSDGFTTAVKGKVSWLAEPDLIVPVMMLRSCPRES